MADSTGTASPAGVVVINGSNLEGGGQILRNAVALSALLSKPVKIERIREGRSPPGLKNQHRTGLELAAQIANAELTGATNSSTEITFTPGGLALPNHFTADAVTAGSTTLLLQLALPLLLFSKQDGKSTLTLKGGTNAIQAPQVDYTQHIFLRFLNRHLPGPEISLKVKKRGYFPKGGGEVFVEVTPTPGKLPAFTLLKRGRVLSIGGIAHIGGLPYDVGRRMVKAARSRLTQARYSASDGVDLRIEIEMCEVKGPGSGIVLWAELEGGGIIGGSVVGKKGVDSGKTGEQAAEELLKALDEDEGCVDEWVQDQIIVLMALAEGRSSVKCGKGGLTLHTRTAIWVAEQLTDARFEVEEEPSGHPVIHCQGIGYEAQG